MLIFFESLFSHHEWINESATTILSIVCYKIYRNTRRIVEKSFEICTESRRVRQKSFASKSLLFGKITADDYNVSYLNSQFVIIFVDLFCLIIATYLFRDYWQLNSRNVVLQYLLNCICALWINRFINIYYYMVP